VLGRTPIDLSAHDRDGDIHLISPPQQFEGGEEAYDAHIGGANNPNLLRPGRGAWRLITRHAGRPVTAWLEIGAGGGTCTLGLIAATPGVTALVTDTSPQFLRIIQRKLAAAGLAADSVSYATLAGEHLEALPAESFDAIIIASALHHVWDWRAAVAAAARVLRPGGVLVLQEPCREGNLMMGMVLDVALSPLWPQTARLDQEDLERLRRCRDSIYYLADTSIPKAGEDKHSFLPNELVEGASDAGFRHSYFYSNFHFQDLADSDADDRRARMSFLSYLDSFLEHHHRISPAGMATLRESLFPVFAGLDHIFTVGDGAALLGSLVLRK
jgi:ubiquinone/menaquinone biosynthesis C-methylase UbiE